MTATDPLAGRTRQLASGPAREGRYVLYWMERSQRAEDNPALEEGVARANALGCPLVVVVALDPDGPGASERRYRFLLEGLQETAATLERRGIRLLLRFGSPPDVALALARDARWLVCDRVHLRHGRRWRERLAAEAGCPVTEVDGDVVVPVEAASQRLEVAARTFRPRVMAGLEAFLALPEPQAVRVRADALELPASEPLDRPARTARDLAGGRGPGPVSGFHPGGASTARTRLERFVAERLPRYGEDRIRVPGGAGSELSMYLHAGQLSPLRLAWEVRGAAARARRAAQEGAALQGAGAGAVAAGADALIEQLVVRRELAINFVTQEPAYDRYEALPGWARATLAEHRGDPRDPCYDEAQLVAAETDDPYWNAAMREMTGTGAMHPTMRMYWGKQLLLWARTPEEGFERTLRLNDRFFLDGRDPNGYANVAWCYGLHDRPFPERAVFGKVRSMTAGGLRRKHDPEGYVAAVERRLAGSA